MMASMQHYETGANRSSNLDKIDYEGHLSPLAIRRFGQYMHKKKFLSDGTTRASDNWQLGIPLDDYMKSILRHVEDLWLHHRGFGAVATETLNDSLCGLMFNVQGYMHEDGKLMLEELVHIRALPRREKP